MKIIDIKTYPICSMSEKAAYYSQDVVDRRMALIVEVITDEGISGWGEGFCSGQNPLILKAIVDNAYTPKLIGRDPFDNDVIYETLYNMSRSYGQSGSAIIALSAIDVALWGRTICLRSVPHRRRSLPGCSGRAGKAIC